MVLYDKGILLEIMQRRLFLVNSYTFIAKMAIGVEDHYVSVSRSIEYWKQLLVTSFERTFLMLPTCAHQ